MNGRRVITLTLALLLPMLAGQAAGQESLKSLRGMTPIEDPAPSPQNKPRKIDRSKTVRNYAQQPPLIPHPTFAYRIDRKQNKCLSCHSAANHEKSGAPQVGQTHYRDRDGKVLDHVSSLRYFCTQCHVGQFPVKPLVESTFKPAAAQQ